MSPKELAPIGQPDVFSTSTEELDVASPPYASTQELPTPGPSTQYQPDLPSPAYASRINLMEGEKLTHEPRSANDSPHPRVHYPEKLRERPPSTDLNNYNSRPASIATTDTDEYGDNSDYDWSGEDDLVDQEAKFEERFQGKKKKRGWFKRFITFMFSSLIGSTLLAGIIVTPGILIHFYYYLPNPTEHRRYVKDNVQAWLFWAAANLLVSWYLALIVDLIPIVVVGFIGLAWGHVSEQIKSRHELYNSVKNTFKPVLYGAAGWVSWIIVFEGIYKLHNDDWVSSRAQYTNRISQVIEFFFFLGLVVCAQRMLSHAIAYSFHRTAFKDRLEGLNEALKVIEKLRVYKPRPSSRAGGSRTPRGLGGFPSLATPFTDKGNMDFFTGALNQHQQVQSARDTAGSDADVEDERTIVGSTMKSRKKGSWFRGSSNQTTLTSKAGKDTAMELGQLNGSLSPEHRYPPSSSKLNTPRHSPRPSLDGSRRNSSEDVFTTAAKAVKTAVLHDARNIKGEDLDGNGVLGAWNIATGSAAKNLARVIYSRLKAPGRNYLLPQDFHPAFATPEEAEAGFRVFDKDNNGDLSRAEIKTTFLKVYKERRFLARSMRDVSVALKTLDHILLFFAMVILFFISLSVFGVEVGNSLTSVYTIGIAASFIFKNAASSAFDAIMFLFVTHPFDTGDRVFIDEEVLVVKKMGLFATIFTRADGTETYYFNSQLFSKFITNVRRSGKMYELATIHVAWNTPMAKLDALESCLNSWLSTEENRWFEPATSLTIQKIEYQRYMEITFPMGHNGTWQDWGLRLQRRSAFYVALHYYCHQLGIVAYEAPMPIVYGTNYEAAAAGAPLDEGHDGRPDLHRSGSGKHVDILGSPVDPHSPAVGPEEANEPVFVSPDGKEIKSLFGFYPPESTRERLRVRKSRKSRARGAGQVGGGE